MKQFTTPCVTTLNHPQFTVALFDACDDSTSAKAWVHGQKTEAAGATPTKLAVKLSGTVCKGLSTAKMCKAAGSTMSVQLMPTLKKERRRAESSVGASPRV